MRLRWKELFASNVDADLPWNRWDFVAIAVAFFAVIWVFALKLKTFFDLGYTTDLFASVQLARSWLEGRGLLTANWFPHMLSVHTYFLLVPLGLIAKPFGAPGLLFVLALSVGAAYFWATRVLRLLGVGGSLAITAAGVLFLSPLSVAFYQDPVFGFHVEILAPTLCLILFYFLLRQRLIPSILSMLAVISVKEDAPIAASIVAIVAAVETLNSPSGKRSGSRYNWTAIIIMCLSLLMIPLLLAISWSQSPKTYSDYTLRRLGIAPPGSLSGPSALFGFISSHATDWLGSGGVRQWLWVMLVGSFGAILLRPYYLIPGVLTTLVAWLMKRNDLFWTPRFYSTQVLLCCVTVVGFASVVRALILDKSWARFALLAATILLITLSASAQLRLVPTACQAYLLRSDSPYSPVEREQADAIFSRYRLESKPDQPVVASPMLFRYAHDRNLFSLAMRLPVPIWILGDSADKFGQSVSSEAITVRWPGRDAVTRPDICIEDYIVVDQRGRFVLLRKKEE
jgi:Predicted membrane protein (DUF2079)